MKNIHVLSTDKQSRLWVNNLRRRLELDEFYSKHQTNLAKNIYITNDEEIKEGDYMYDIDGDVGKAIGSDMKEFEGNKKITLATDLDLIADGVQAIDDDFLEWFVKNPSCESVEVVNEIQSYKSDRSEKWVYEYKIIIPKEEPKQDYSGVHLRHCYQGEYKDSCKYGEDDCPTKPLEEPKQYFYCSDRLELDENERCVTQCNHCASKPKQRLEKYSERFDNDKYPIGNTETWGKRIAVDIEQAAIELVQDGTIEGYYDTFAYYEKKGFVKGAEWHQKRSYSEEEAGELVYNIIGEYAKEYGITIDGAKLNDLFNQLKKQ
jgi:hypothetical protein